MFKNLVKTFGFDPTDRDLKRYSEVARHIATLDAHFTARTDAELRAYTDTFRARLAEAGQGLDEAAQLKAEEKVLNEILPEAFALVREVAKRQLGLRHYDVQMIGGQVLHEGRAAEMRTGEGKTLVATLPVYLNALTGRGVHLITVNDYLAQRDAVWMAPIYHALGMKVGILQAAFKTDNARKAYMYDPEKPEHVRLVDRPDAYLADITYGTNNEFGFDYLRDNMAMRLSERRQRTLYYAIIDEVDNVLIDQARTPLIISGPSGEAADLYLRLAQVVKQLNPELYEIDERNRNVSLTDEGYEKIEEMLGQTLRDPDRPEDLTPEQAQILGHLEQALRAQFLFQRNKDYILQGRKVVIVDPQTGRATPGRRWSDGLHQAIEAKEGVQIESENVTYASITLQNYFRMYKKLAGMSGTVVTESEEFREIYKVDVVPVPTKLDWEVDNDTSLQLTTYKESGHKFEMAVRKDNPSEAVMYRRKDYEDLIFRSEESKLRNLMTDVLMRHVKGQPLLLGTTSVELSEKLSNRLRAEALRRLALVYLLREVWFEKHNREPDGRAIAELEPLNEPLESLNEGKMRPMARELDLRLNPTHDENLDRLCRLFDLDEPDQREKLRQVLEGGIAHRVLNAKEHESESLIIAEAGRPYALTVATNMAGRGVDIKLGGELEERVHQTVYKLLNRAGLTQINALDLLSLPFETISEIDHKDAHVILNALIEREVLKLSLTQEELVNQFRDYMARYYQVHALGGLHVIGSERHEARRIDNQLRGRAARQGDIGSSRFYLSLQDELMRRFGGENVSNLMVRFQIDEMLPMEHNLVTKVVEQSQTRVEGANFDMRKHVLEYDDVLNEQRQRVYSQRDRILTKTDIREDLEELLLDEIESRVADASSKDEGWWPLLDWVDKLQPVLISSPRGERPLFSFSLSLVLEQLAGQTDIASARARLIDIAHNASDAANSQLLKSVDRGLQGLRERAKSFAESRREEVDMAYEGLIEEARETDAELNPHTVARQLAEVANLNPRQLDNRLLNDMQPRKVRDYIADLVESDAGLRVVQAWLTAYRRRLGLKIEFDLPAWKDLNWAQLERSILNSIEDEREVITKRQLEEIESILNEKLTDAQQLANYEYLGRLLNEISVERQMGIDRRTFKVVQRVNQRFPYIYYAAELLNKYKSEQIEDNIRTHIAHAQRFSAEAMGQEELARLARNSIDTLDAEIQRRLQAKLGDAPYAEVQSMALSDLPDALRPTVADVLGDYRQQEIYRELMLSVITGEWVQYLTTIEGVRTSAGLEAFAQRDPLTAYKSRAFDEFRTLLGNIRGGVVSRMFRYQPRSAETSQVSVDREASEKASQRRNIGRNEPCWCGSGKKYKNCHMKADLKGGQSATTAVTAQTNR